MHIAMAHCSTKADRLSAKQASGSKLCTFFYIIVYNLQRNNPFQTQNNCKMRPPNFFQPLFMPICAQLSIKMWITNLKTAAHLNFFMRLKSVYPHFYILSTINSHFYKISCLLKRTAPRFSVGGLKFIGSGNTFFKKTGKWYLWTTVSMFSTKWRLPALSLQSTMF